MGLPTWAASSDASSGKGHGPTTAPGQLKDADEHGTSHGHGTSGTGHKGKSHKCKPHGVAFVLGGVFEKDTLVLNSDGTYSGEIVLKEVTHMNRHVRDAKTKGPFTVTSAHVSFDLTDINADGTVGLDDLKEGDDVTLIGKITTIAKKCDHSSFTPKITFRKVTFSTP
jgi:hypothetical protein